VQPRGGLQPKRTKETKKEGPIVPQQRLPNHNKSMMTIVLFGNKVFIVDRNQKSLVKIKGEC